MTPQHQSSDDAESQPPLAALEAGTGRPLILLHGGVGSRTHWKRNIAGLANHFHVIAIDLPGYGASPNVPVGIEPSQYTDWVINAVARAGGEQFDLVGFSFGGALAARAAASLGNRVSKLSLIAPGGFGVPVGRALPTLKVPAKSAPEEERRKAVAANLGSWMLSETPAAGSDAVSIQLANIDRTRFDSRKVSLRETLIEDLRSTPVPLQMIWGAGDPLAFPSIEARVRSCRTARPDLEFDLIPGASHWVQYDRPNEVNQCLLRFLLD